MYIELTEYKDGFTTKSCLFCKSDNLSKFIDLPGSHGWVKSYHCNDCRANFIINYGDKQGGGYDIIQGETEK